VRHSLTISTGASAAEERSCCTITSRQRRRPRWPNDTARQAGGLWAQLRMAWLARRTAPGQKAAFQATNGTTVGRNCSRRSSSQDDQGSATQAAQRESAAVPSSHDA
jgi:hypothetical protein